MARKFGEEEFALFRRVMRRCEIERLSSLPLTNGGRMGAYAAALCGDEDRIMAVSLDGDYLPVRHAVLHREGGALPEDFREDIVKLCRRDGAGKVMLCASHRIDAEETLSFNRLFLYLRAAGIAVVDLFEVHGYCYYSILSEFLSCEYPEDK